jgi:hypothetical protein
MTTRTQSSLTMLLALQEACQSVTGLAAASQHLRPVHTKNVRFSDRRTYTLTRLLRLDDATVAFDIEFLNLARLRMADRGRGRLAAANQASAAKTRLVIRSLPAGR